MVEREGFAFYVGDEYEKRRAFYSQCQIITTLNCKIRNNYVVGLYD